MEEKEDNRTKNIKILFISTAFIISVLILISKVFGIMFVDNDRYQKEAYSQKTAERIEKAERGELLDRNGEVFALSLTVSTFFLDPRLIKQVYDEYEKEGDVDILFDYLAEELELDKEYLIRQLEYDTHYRVIANGVSGEKAERIVAFRDLIGFKGLFREKESIRFYPNNALAAHVAGCLNAEKSGRLGLELYYNSTLTGIDGLTITEVDGLGREIPFSKTIEVPPTDGSRIFMTIDKNIQLLTQEALRKAIDEYDVLNGGCIIVMEPSTGKILAMASYPEFDSNEPYGISGPEGVDTDYLQQFVWRNKAVSDTYEPGSTFKVITAAACLEENVVLPDDIIDSGPVIVEGWEIRHWMQDASAYESFSEAMRMSSNPVFVRAAQKLGIQRFYEYIERFGFKSITGVTLPAEANSIFRDRPTELDMAVNSFGQRFQITPIQLITSYCSIANGGWLVKPYIVDRITDNSGKTVFMADSNRFRQVISEETSDSLRYMLEDTVTHGTGKNAYVMGYRVAGKTGTSETLETEQGRYIASFAGFAPADNPKIALLVMLDFPSSEHHGGGYVAAPTAGELIEKILMYLRIERRYTEYDMAIISQEAVIPDITGIDAEDAENILRDENIRYYTIGNTGTEVIRQVPAGGTRVSMNPTVMIYKDERVNKIVEMPDLTGLTKQETAAKLKSIDLNVVFTGFGETVAQSYKHGEMLEPGTVVYINLKEMAYANED